MNKLSLALSVALAVAAVAASGAQTTSSPAEKGKQLTVVGCLERAPASSDAIIGTSGTDPSPIFVLRKRATQPSGTLGAAGTSGNTDQKSATAEYRLVTPNIADLELYEGSMVEVTGTMERGASSARKGETGEQASSSRAPMLKVTSFKRISSSCSG